MLDSYVPPLKLHIQLFEGHDEDESTDANLDQESDAEANDTDEEEVVEN